MSVMGPRRDGRLASDRAVYHEYLLNMDWHKVALVCLIIFVKYLTQCSLRFPVDHLFNLEMSFLEIKGAEPASFTLCCHAL